MAIDIPMNTDGQAGDCRTLECHMPPRFIAEQLSHPRGLRGWLVRRGMNRGNARANAFATEQLDLQPNDSVLEVGFGGGVNIQRFLAQGVSVVGVDRSSDAVKAAGRRFARERSDGRAKFLLGEVEALPLADESCSKAVTVHTVYFWTSLDRGFGELYRCLRRGGRLVVGFVPKVKMDQMGMPPDIFTPRNPDDLSAAARHVGFVVDIRRPGGGEPWMVLVGRKPD
jgi:SAM-dependent methyltransferase